MSCSTLPYGRPWPCGRTGRTWDGVQYEIAGTGTLSAVSAIVKDSAGTVALTLSTGAGGVTLTSGTSGAWDFEIDQITAVSLASGYYSFEVTLTLSSGEVTDWFIGSWRIQD